MKKQLLIVLFTLLVMAGAYSQSTNPAPYCVAGYDDGATSGSGGIPVDDAIYNVSLGTLSNATNSQFALPHYVFYNNLSAPMLTKGNTYTLSVTLNAVGSCSWGVWIDYNQNQQFEANELVAGSNSVATSPPFGIDTIAGNITIPSGALSGTTRMRVRIVEDDIYNANNNYAAPACNPDTSHTGVMDWGETEDYNVSISGGTTGINQLQVAGNLQVYPNPASEVLFFKTPLAEPMLFAIYNYLGQRVLQGSMNAGGNSLDIGTFNKGLYFIKLYTADNIATTASFTKQ